MCYHPVHFLSRLTHYLRYIEILMSSGMVVMSMRFVVAVVLVTEWLGDFSRLYIVCRYFDFPLHFPA
jgi:hypothetical protein